MNKSAIIAAISILITFFASLSCNSPQTTLPPQTTPETTPPSPLQQETEITDTPAYSPSVTSSTKSSLLDEIEISQPRNVGSTITVDARKLKIRLGTDFTFVWKQLHPPDKYDGVDYFTGYAVELVESQDGIISFRPTYPGNYRLQLTIEGVISKEDLCVDVPVTLPKSPFEIKGIAYDMWHYTDELAYMSEGFVKRAKDTGANLIMLSPTLYMASATANDMAPYPAGVTDKSICRGAMKDEDLIKMIREAHTAGLQVMVKMILQVANPEGTWIEKNPSNWDEWFQNWTEVCLHYGKVAEQEGVEYFAVGNELRESVSYTEEWRSLISEVRKVYNGKLTYGDNSISSGLLFGEYGYFQAWDALDVIGVHFYGPVTGVYGSKESNHPSVEEMAVVFEKYLEEVLDPIVKKYNKPVIFLEFGTASYDGTNIGHFNYNQTVDNAEQSEYYEAGLAAISSRDYVEGVNIWAYTWEPFDLGKHTTMSPIGKPAEQVIHHWFGSID